jgi:autotransporter-associated beta strand protein
VVARTNNGFGTGAFNIYGGAIGSVNNFNSPTARLNGINVLGDFQIGISGSTGSASSTANMTFSGTGSALSLGSATRKITLGNSGSMTFGGVISDGGLTLTRNADGAAGSFGLSGTNTFAGGLTIDGVTVNASNVNTALGAGSVTLGGASGFDSKLNIKAALTLANNITIADGAGAKTITNTGANATINGTITNNDNTGSLQIGSGAGRNLVLANGIGGTGTSDLLIGGTSAGTALSGQVTINGASNYSGNTIINSARVNLGANNALSQNDLSLLGTGILDLQGYGQTLTGISGDSTSKVQSSGSLGTLTVNTGATSTTYAGSILSTGGDVALVKDGSATLTLTGANTFTGGVTVDDGELRVSTASLRDQAVGLTVTTSTLTFDQASDGTFGGDITGAGSLVKEGAGVVTIVGANTYTGETAVLGGALIGTTDSIRGNLFIDTGANVAFDQAANATTSRIISGGGSLSILGAGAITLTGANTYSGGTTVSNGTLIGKAGVGIQGDIVNDSIVTFDQTTGSSTYIGDMSGAGAVTVDGSGNTLTMTGNNSYTGGTTLTAGTSLTGSVSSLTGDIVAAGAGSTVTFNQASGSGTYFGTISGAASLVKSGVGEVILDADQIYTGPTTVSAGTLILGGNLATSSITVDNGATLGGTGATAGGASMTVNGNLNPGEGAAVGTLEAAGITLAGTSTTTMSLVSDGSGSPGTAGLDYDTVIARSNLAYDGNLVIRFENSSLYTNGSFFDLFDAATFDVSANSGQGFAGITTAGTGPYSGLTFAYVPGDAGTPARWATPLASQFLVFLPSTGQLVIVPEPSTWAMTVMSAGFAGWMARRKKLAMKRRTA